MKTNTNHLASGGSKGFTSWPAKFSKCEEADDVSILAKSDAFDCGSPGRHPIIGNAAASRMQRRASARKWDLFTVAQASSPASSSGVSPRERNPKRGARRPANSQARTPALQKARSDKARFGLIAPTFNCSENCRLTCQRIVF